MKININKYSNVKTFDIMGFSPVVRRNYMKHRLLVIEEMISEFENASFKYAMNGFGGRFKLGEPAIFRSLYLYFKYTEKFPESKIHEN